MWKYIGVSQMPHTPHTKSPINFYIDSTSPELHTSYTDSTSDIYIGMSKMPHTPYTNSTNFFYKGYFYRAAHFIHWFLNVINKKKHIVMSK